MEEKGQLMGVPIKLVMALVIGTMVMGILTQFVGTAERTVLKDMKVTFSRTTGGDLGVTVKDAQSGDALGGATITVKYPGGTMAKTLADSTNTYTFSDIPMGSADVIVVNVHVTRNGYIPWEGEAAVHR